MIEMRELKEVKLNDADKKISYGEGEYNKMLFKWSQTDRLIFDRIMKATTYTSEILLLREYKNILEELDTHRHEINHIEPPLGMQEKHQQLVSMNELAYLSCLYYFKDSQKSHYYFKKYISAYYQLYITNNEAKRMSIIFC